MTLTIQKADSSDIDTIWNIVQLCSASLVDQGFENWTRYTKEKIEGVFETSNIYLLVENKNVIGTITISEQMPSYYTENDMKYWADKNAAALYFTTLAILPSEQGKGYGSKLIKFAEEECKKQNIQYLRMTSLHDNTKLSNFYLKKGFHIVQTGLVAPLNLILNFYEKKI